MNAPKPFAIRLELTSDQETISVIDTNLGRCDDPGVVVTEADPSNPALHSSTVETIAILLGSAGAGKAFRDVLIEYLRTRRAKIRIKDLNAGVEIVFEGPLRNQRKVEQLVETITASNSSERDHRGGISQ